MELEDGSGRSYGHYASKYLLLGNYSGRLHVLHWSSQRYQICEEYRTLDKDLAQQAHS